VIALQSAKYKDHMKATMCRTLAATLIATAAGIGVLSFRVSKAIWTTEDGDLEIDNNRTERSIFGSDQGGHTAAVLRSFVASCQRVGVDPYAWFQDVLTRMAPHPITRLAELLPHN